MARVVHFEIMATNPERAIDFYKKVFGWKITGDAGENYWIAKTGDEYEQGIDGAILGVKGDSSLVNIIEVSYIDDAIKKIEEYGCRIVIPKRSIPGVGTVAYFRDTEGLLVGLLEPAGSRAP
jgi:uncharacterized protein